jgi:TPR repeat protein
MPAKLIGCISLPPASLLSVPIYEFAIANEDLADEETEAYYPCCGKSICKGCAHSFCKSENMKCPFCNSDQADKTDEDRVAELMKRVEANDPGAMCLLAGNYHCGGRGVQQDQTKAIELWSRAADLGNTMAHNNLADIYDEEGYLKKAKFHYEAAAMAGCEVARCTVGYTEHVAGNVERAVKHWTIAASAGNYEAMYNLLIALKKRDLSRESIDSTLEAYNNSCAEMRSEARDACLQVMMENDLYT